MKKSQPLVFFGTESFSAASLEKLLSDGWPIKLVVTKPDFKRGRGQKVNEPLVKVVAKQHSVGVIQPQKLSSVKDDLAAAGAEFAILVAYGKLIPRTIIDVFPGGIINLHPSLLPKYRGPAPIESAILNGDKSTGLSLMKLTEQMDAGPVYAQKKVPLTGAETQPELYSKLAKQGAEFLAENLGKIIGGGLGPKAQDDTQASYTKLIEKNAGTIDWSKSADQIEHEIRAYLSWPGSHTNIWGLDVTIVEAHALPGLDGPASEVKVLDEGVLMVSAGAGCLSIDRLKPAGKKEMSAADFIRGYKHLAA